MPEEQEVKDELNKKMAADEEQESDCLISTLSAMTWGAGLGVIVGAGRLSMQPDPIAFGHKGTVVPKVLGWRFLGRGIGPTVIWSTAVCGVYKATECFVKSCRGIEAESTWPNALAGGAAAGFTMGAMSRRFDVMATTGLCVGAFLAMVDYNQQIHNPRHMPNVVQEVPPPEAIDWDAVKNQAKEAAEAQGTSFDEETWDRLKAAALPSPTSSSSEEEEVSSSSFFSEEKVVKGIEDLTKKEKQEVHEFLEAAFLSAVESGFIKEEEMEKVVATVAAASAASAAGDEKTLKKMYSDKKTVDEMKAIVEAVVMDKFKKDYCNLPYLLEEGCITEEEHRALVECRTKDEYDKIVKGILARQKSDMTEEELEYAEELVEARRRERRGATKDGGGGVRRVSPSEMEAAMRILEIQYLKEKYPKFKDL